MRKYLKTAKEIINALKKGKKLMQEGRIGSYMMIDDVLCYFDGNCTEINAILPLSTDFPVYIDILGPKPELKLEVGKFYVNRSHEIVLCAYKSDSGKFIVVRQDDGSDYYVSAEGTNQNRNLDIVGECRVKECE